MKYTLTQRLAAFNAKINKYGPVCKHLGTRCHIWTSQKDSCGYGLFLADKKQLRAHRYAWQLENGVIPSNLKVLHKCDNRSCCNTLHLYLGTQLDNMRDMMIRHTRNYILVSAQAKAIKEEYAAGGISMQKLAEKYGLKSAQSIFKIVHGTDWMYAC